jgi:hypothetical protein
MHYSSQVGVDAIFILICMYINIVIDLIKINLKRLLSRFIRPFLEQIEHLSPL